METGTERGWFPGSRIEYLRDGRHIRLSDDYDGFGLSILIFGMQDYWGSHYSNRPWFSDDRWRRDHRWDGDRPHHADVPTGPPKPPKPPGMPHDGTGDPTGQKPPKPMKGQDHVPGNGGQMPAHVQKPPQMDKPHMETPLQHRDNPGPKRMPGANGIGAKKPVCVPPQICN